MKNIKPSLPSSYKDSFGTFFSLLYFFPSSLRLTVDNFARLNLKSASGWLFLKCILMSLNSVNTTSHSSHLSLSSESSSFKGEVHIKYKWPWLGDRAYIWRCSIDHLAKKSTFLRISCEMLHTVCDEVCELIVKI